MASRSPQTNQRSVYEAGQKYRFPISSLIAPRASCGYEPPIQNVTPAAANVYAKRYSDISNFIDNESVSDASTTSSHFYSFANISDNTTKVKHRNSKSSYVSNSDGEDCGQPVGISKTGSIGYKRSLDLGIILEDIGDSSGKSNAQELNKRNLSLLLDRSSCMTVKRNASLKYSSSSSISIPNRSTNLKRSNAVRCKGGLLQFFTQCSIRTRKRLKRWKLAIRKKLFKFRKITPNKKSRGHAITTSHLQRANGYVSNISRSLSVRSGLGNIPNLAHLSRSSSQLLTTDSSSYRRANSLRRSPSSIKRAATVLRSSPSLFGASLVSKESTGVSIETENSTARSSQMVRSQVSTSLNSLLRQPSIVVNNKVVPLSTYTAKSNYLPISERDEDQELNNDNYVINPSNQISTIREVSDTSESKYGSTVAAYDDECSIMSSHYHDASAVPPAQYDDDYDDDEESIIAYNNSIERAKEVWHQFLRKVIASRIKDRLQTLKFPAPVASNNNDTRELLDSIIKLLMDNDLLAVNKGEQEESSCITSRVDSSMSSNPMFALPAAIADVRRSLTMPVGLNYK
ncbi:HEL144Wp [Eremothecium sinecaudum]|uniref:HEL144Wp n=1 Tax=Eremothecium sinecaudum TaxID=45286 RepID=A0A120K2D1_9SACH|nr:HEL144Wp [Eremothecium sinecaudum]AMD21137.1 HEL144Wp [Eremothecium sinecaudum]